MLIIVKLKKNCRNNAQIETVIEPFGLFFIAHFLRYVKIFFNAAFRTLAHFLVRQRVGRLFFPISFHLISYLGFVSRCVAEVLVFGVCVIVFSQRLNITMLIFSAVMVGTVPRSSPRNHLELLQLLFSISLDSVRPRARVSEEEQ